MKNLSKNGIYIYILLIHLSFSLFQVEDIADNIMKTLTENKPLRISRKGISDKVSTRKVN